MKVSAIIFFTLCFGKATSQNNDFFNPHEYLQKKIAEQNKKLELPNAEKFWEEYKKVTAPDFDKLNLFRTDNILPGMMPVIMMQPSAAGIMPVIKVKPPELGIIPDAAKKVE